MAKRYGGGALESPHLFHSFSFRLDFFPVVTFFRDRAHLCAVVVVFLLFNITFILARPIYTVACPLGISRVCAVTNIKCEHLADLYV